MEIVRKDLYQQTAISADLNNVASEIKETVKSSGISSVASTWEVFDNSKIGMPANGSTIPVISNAADYIDPAAALARQVNSSLQPAASSQELLKIIRDPKFRAESEIDSIIKKKESFGLVLDRISEFKGSKVTESVQLGVEKEGTMSPEMNIPYNREYKLVSENAMNNLKPQEMVLNDVETKNPYGNTPSVLVSENSVSQPGIDLSNLEVTRTSDSYYESAMKGFLDELKKIRNI